MAYDYTAEKPRLFTDQGQRVFLQIRDRAHKLLEEAGAFREDRVERGVSTPDSWFAIACLDRLVELGELKELTGPMAAGQDRVFTSRK
jgi:hypothetical protein